MDGLQCLISGAMGAIFGLIISFAHESNTRENQGIPRSEVIEQLRKDCEAELPRNKICLTEAIIELKIVDRVK